MGLIRSLEALDPRMRPIAADLLVKCEAAGHKLYVFETMRTQGVQDAYYAQGRKPLIEVNAARAAAGLYALSEAENRRTITDSPLLVYKGIGHGNGTAMDVVPVTNTGKLLWNTAPDVWKEIGEIGELCGLVWGGRWKPIDARTGLGFDPGHFQLPRV